jgi:hypothetical protein
LATLHRHAGATCVELERVLGLGIRAPKKWGPFASLAFLVTEASRRARDARDAEREERVRQRSLESKAPPAHERNPFRDDDDDAFDDDADYDGGFGSAPNGSEPRAKTTGRSLMTSVFGGAAVHGKRFQKHFRARVTRARETTTGDSDDAEERRGGETTCERIAFGAASVAELAELGWDLVEHPARAASRRQSSQSGEKDATAPAMLPPPPSAPEDVEHWTRAMYVDARR